MSGEVEYPEAEHGECVPKEIADQWLAQVERLQSTIEKYQQKENDRAHFQPGPSNDDPAAHSNPSLDAPNADPSTDPTTADSSVPEDDATEGRPADRIQASTTPAALSEVEWQALIDAVMVEGISWPLRPYGLMCAALKATVERILAARGLVSEPDGLAERVE
ncbi:hypothetical protein EFK50_07715, partial [Nocardioides marmoriginsengisoli]